MNVVTTAGVSAARGARGRAPRADRVPTAATARPAQSARIAPPGDAKTAGGLVRRAGRKARHVQTAGSGSVASRRPRCRR